MKWNGRKVRSSLRQMSVFMILGILITLQTVAVTLPVSQGAYLGIAFGSEAEVGSDGTNDVWKLDIQKYYYVANEQSKPEIDLVGLNITRGVDDAVIYQETDNITIESIDNGVTYNYTFTFSLPLIKITNVSYTFTTNYTYANSTVEWWSWTAGAFSNQSLVTNHNGTLEVEHYNKSLQEQEVLIQVNVTHTSNFTLSFNITLEIEYSIDQIISINYLALPVGNASLNDNVKTWIFFDTDGDDVIDYAIRWIYGGKAALFEITPDSFYSDGVWTGALKKYWTGINWSQSVEGTPMDIGILEENRLNVTVPSFILNLTETVRYSVWALKIEANYHWWDALPDDPNWQISFPIPGFEMILIGVSILFIGLLIAIKIKRSPNKLALEQGN